MNRDEFQINPDVYPRRVSGQGGLRSDEIPMLKCKNGPNAGRRDLVKQQKLVLVKVNAWGKAPLYRSTRGAKPNGTK